MWWEIRKLAVVVVAVDALVALICIAVCALFGNIGFQAVGTAMFLSGMAFALLAGGIGSGPVRMSMGPTGLSPLSRFETAEMEAELSTRNVQYGIDQFRNVSWPLALGVTAVSLLVVGALFVGVIA